MFWVLGEKKGECHTLYFHIIFIPAWKGAHFSIRFKNCQMHNSQVMAYKKDVLKKDRLIYQVLTRISEAKKSAYADTPFHILACLCGFSKRHNRWPWLTVSRKILTLYRQKITCILVFDDKDFYILLFPWWKRYNVVAFTSMFPFRLIITIPRFLVHVSRHDRHHHGNDISI